MRYAVLSRVSKLAIALTSCLAIGSIVTSSAWATNWFPMTPNNGIYSMCATSLGGGVGTKLQLWQCNSGPNQNWTWAGSGSNLLKNEGDGLCISDLGAFGNDIDQYMESCNSSTNQQYRVNLSCVNMEIWLENGQAGYVLSSLGATTNGAPVVEWASDGSSNQSWRFSACF